VLVVVIGVAVFAAFFWKADRNGRNGFRWGLLGATTFLLVSSVVSVLLLQTIRPNVRGADGLITPSLALLGVGTAAGLAASAVLFMRALASPGPGNSDTKAYRSTERSA
jgi:hypothetical protein